MPRLLALAALLFALPAQAIVTVDWVTVGGPGNAADNTGFGAVAARYRISKTEVTNAQYSEFLNAVATTDTNALYHPNMALLAWLGGILRSGSSGSYTYSTRAGREDWPVNLVTFWDAIRFANWLHNGQPTGAQDNTTTEDGAYTITALGISNNSITRNSGAKASVASENEWYKAAYYDIGSMSYFDYPAGSDTQTTCAPPSGTANTANCNDVLVELGIGRRSCEIRRSDDAMFC